MDFRDPFLNLSPLDHRYWLANPVLFEKLAETLSEKAVLRYNVKAELALLRAHITLQFDSNPRLLLALEGVEDRVEAEEVADEEAITQHQIRAIVRVIKRYLPKELLPWVHLGATSVDILDTATAMRIRDTFRSCLLPLCLKLLKGILRLADSEAQTAQVGRTHGQRAVPITFGFAMAEYVSRLGQSLQRLEFLSKQLRGKLSGAVGAYNASSLLSKDPRLLEKNYLDSLGLQGADYANQIVEPEHLLRLLLEVNIAFGIIANLADDLRHLQRSEIAEVSENFGEGQVGSSTMPQKRNPWNSEHVKSLWKAFSPRVMTFYMDQISEHQRDLSNSASGRFVADYLAGFAAALARMEKVIKGLVVHPEKMQENLGKLGDAVLAEPSYILLALAGYDEAHEIVRQVSLEAEKSGRSLRRVFQEDKPKLWKALSEQLKAKQGSDARTFYDNPALYQGLASKRTQDLVAQYDLIARSIEKDLTAHGNT